MKKAVVMACSLVFLGFTSQQATASDIDGAKLFKSKCKMCHKMDGKKMGPSVAQMNSDLKGVVTHGRKMMPAYGEKLEAAEIDALVTFLKDNGATDSK